MGLALLNLSSQQLRRPLVSEKAAVKSEVREVRDNATQSDCLSLAPRFLFVDPFQQIPGGDLIRWEERHSLLEPPEEAKPRRLSGRGFAHELRPRRHRHARAAPAAARSIDSLGRHAGARAAVLVVSGKDSDAEAAGAVRAASGDQPRRRSMKTFAAC
jgi:hypothetical protein